jgi:hypothetical protein
MHHFSTYALIGTRYGGGYRRYGRGGKKKQTTRRKKKHENWFESLTMDKLKELCKASTKVPHTGKKADLVTRLCEDDSCSRFAFERTSKYSSVGVNMAYLKEMCRSRSLSVSGVKYEVVLRILQHDNDGTKTVTSSTSGTKRAPLQDAKTEPAAKKSKPTESQVVYNKRMLQDTDSEEEEDHDEKHDAKPAAVVPGKKESSIASKTIQKPEANHAAKTGPDLPKENVAPNDVAGPY